MKKIIILIMAFSFVFLTGCNKKEKLFDSLDHVAIKELDVKIKNKDSFIVYFAFIENDETAKKFQNKYIENELTKGNLTDLLVVNLDAIMPNAYYDENLRKEITSKFKIKYFPSLVYYKNGNQVAKVEWSIENNDEQYGLKLDVVQEFIEKSNEE